MRYFKEDYIALYAEANINQDHGISAKELNAFLKKKKMDPDTDRVKKFFAKFDINNDGVLQLPEWIELMEAIFYERII
ncbi:EF-hand_domain [Hexamita inflata]|uniref:EF-hand domain n=1 Tax=Hexamita inflata TaxID=28002 RepID=A0AA86P5P3_9EUKA|nr:EF-hand domain [Hexamita inflata]CAI9941311.1 EF-hand domain [Hexamita inflata]CAI9970264.1 EF-hand domain [Hexamita inflata]